MRRKQGKWRVAHKYNQNNGTQQLNKIEWSSIYWLKMRQGVTFSGRKSSEFEVGKGVANRVNGALTVSINATNNNNNSIKIRTLNIWMKCFRGMSCLYYIIYEYNVSVHDQKAEREGCVRHIATWVGGEKWTSEYFWHNSATAAAVAVAASTMKAQHNDCCNDSSVKVELQHNLSLQQQWRTTVELLLFAMNRTTSFASHSSAAQLGLILVLGHFCCCCCYSWCYSTSSHVRVPLLRTHCLLLLLLLLLFLLYICMYT